MTGGEIVGAAAKPAAIALTPIGRYLKKRRAPKRLVRRSIKDLGATLDRQTRSVLIRAVREDAATAIERGDALEIERLLRSAATKSGVDLSSLLDVHALAERLQANLIRVMPSDLHTQVLHQTVLGAEQRLSGSSQERPNLQSLPFGAEILLGTRPRSDDSRVRALVEAVAPAGFIDPKVGARVLRATTLTNSWEWWQFAATGLVSQDLGDLHSARDLYQRALMLGAPDRDHWLARAAIAAAEDLRSVDCVTFDGSAPAQILAVISSDDLDLRELPPMPPPSPALSTVFERNLQTIAYLLAGEHQRAATIAEETLEAQPSSVAARLRLAQAHLAMASEDAVQRIDHLERAREAARAVRDRTRDRGLPGSADAAGIICKASLMLDDLEAVMEAGFPPPDGSATEGELRSDDARHAGAVAAIMLDRRDLAQRAISDLPDRMAPSLMRANLASLDGQTELIPDLVREAWIEVEDWGVAVSVLLSWARHVDDPLPDLRDKGIDEGQASAHQRVARAMRALRTDEAASRAILRDLVESDPQLGQNLIDLVVTHGDRNLALDAARRLVEVSNDPNVHEFLAQNSFRDDDLAEAERSANAFFAATAGTGFESRARRLLAAILQSQQGRELDVIPHLRWLAESGDSQCQWAYLHHCASTGSVLDAARLFAKWKTEPTEKQHNLLEIRLLLAAGQHEEATEAALRALREWDSDQDFCAAVLGFVHSTGGRLIDDDVLGDRLRHATAEFLERSPSHPGFIAIHGSTDELLEVIRGQLQSRRTAFCKLRWLARTGRYPLGLMTEISSGRYCQVVHARSGISRGRHPDDASHALEVDIALDCVNDAVLVDLSAVVAALDAALWSKVRDCFRSVTVSAASSADIVQALELARFPADGTITTTSDGQITFVDGDSEQAGQERARLEELQRVVRSLKELPYTGPKLLPPEWSGPNYDAWVGTIEIAASQNLPVLNDDFSSRVLSGSLGVRSFGLHALFDALLKRGVLSESEHTDAVGRLALVGSSPASLNGAMPRAIAEAADAASVVRIVGRPLSNVEGWGSGDDTLRLCHQSIERCLELNDASGAADVLALALVGAAEFALLNGLGPAQFATQLAASAAVTASPHGPAAVASLVRALDWFLAEWLDASGEGVARFAESVIQNLNEAGVDSATAAAGVLQLLTGLTYQERRFATAAVLSDDRTRLEPPAIAEVQRILGLSSSNLILPSSDS